MSEEHLKLSSFIKSVHEDLRKECMVLGPEKAWQKHCDDIEKLNQYASAMENLASTHWENNYTKENSKAISRVEWIYNYTKDYFLNGGFQKYRCKEEDISLKINLESKGFDYFDFNSTKLHLLDVGSCYNPFKKFDIFEVTAIDIAPAHETVQKCDFLSLEINTDNKSNTIESTINFIAECFDIVVFCLFLEYLPSPNQRFACCENAYKLLKTEGLLIIITPDSKHVGANAKIMKSWRFILSKLGFMRIKYEKLPYLHCMAFRKSLSMEIATRWSSLQDDTQFYEDFVIPQDFNK